MNDEYAEPWLELALKKMESQGLRSLTVSRLLDVEAFTVRGPAARASLY